MQKGIIGKKLGMTQLFDENGKAKGHFEGTGLKPSFIDKFELNGVELPDDFFDVSQAGGDY